MVWENVLAKFKELFGGEGEIGVYFAPGTCEHDRRAYRLQWRSCISLCTDDRYLWCGKKKK